MTRSAHVSTGGLRTARSCGGLDFEMFCLCRFIAPFPFEVTLWVEI